MQCNVSWLLGEILPGNETFAFVLKLLSWNIMHKKRDEGESLSLCCNSFFWQLFAHHHHLHRSWCHDEFFKDRDHLRGAMTEFFFIISVVMTEFFFRLLHAQNKAPELWRTFLSFHQYSIEFLLLVWIHRCCTFTPTTFQQTGTQCFCVVVQILLHHFQQLWKGFVSC